jgi:hypothetical protein
VRPVLAPRPVDASVVVVWIRGRFRVWRDRENVRVPISSRFRSEFHVAGKTKGTRTWPTTAPLSCRTPWRVRDNVKTTILLAAFLLGVIAVEARGETWPVAWEWPAAVVPTQYYPVAVEHPTTLPTWTEPQETTCAGGQCAAPAEKRITTTRTSGRLFRWRTISRRSSV